MASSSTPTESTPQALLAVALGQLAALASGNEEAEAAISYISAYVVQNNDL